MGRRTELSPNNLEEVERIEARVEDMLLDMEVPIADVFNEKQLRWIKVMMAQAYNQALMDETKKLINLGK